MEELAAEVKKLEVEEQRGLLDCLVYEKQVNVDQLRKNCELSSFLVILLLVPLF